MNNLDIAKRLREHASALSQCGNNVYRIRAFRQAAMTVMGLDQDVRQLGLEELTQVPGIGPSLAETIHTYAITGEWQPRTLPTPRNCR